MTQFHIPLEEKTTCPDVKGLHTGASIEASLFVYWQWLEVVAGGGGRARPTDCLFPARPAFARLGPGMLDLLPGPTCLPGRLCACGTHMCLRFLVATRHGLCCRLQHHVMDYKGATVMLIEFTGFKFCVAVDEEWKYVFCHRWPKFKNWFRRNTQCSELISVLSVQRFQSKMGRSELHIARAGASVSAADEYVRSCSFIQLSYTLLKRVVAMSEICCVQMVLR